MILGRVVEFAVREGSVELPPQALVEFASRGGGVIEFAANEIVELNMLSFLNTISNPHNIYFITTTGYIIIEIH